MNEAKIFGLAGWSGSGKTTLILKVVESLIASGLSVSTLKHTHHNVDIDKPGKDTYRQREAGASEVMLASSRRWALMRELDGEAEWSVDQLVRKMSPVDLVIIEGFKSYPHPKVEVYRPALNKPLLCLDDPSIKAVATDDASAGTLKDLSAPLLDLNDTDAIVDFIMTETGLVRRSKKGEGLGAA